MNYLISSRDYGEDTVAVTNYLLGCLTLVLGASTHQHYLHKNDMARATTRSYVVFYYSIWTNDRSQ